MKPFYDCSDLFRIKTENKMTKNIGQTVYSLLAVA